MVVEKCPECSVEGNIGSGYGGYHLFSCPECDHEWVVDGVL